jgi:hypothetical protein
MKNNKHFRQGDVGIVKVNKVDASKLTRINAINGRNILAYGEATGHHHSCVATKTELYRLDDNRMLLRALEDVGIEHQEHEVIWIPIGDYEVHIQVEYDPEGERRVSD